MTDEDIAAWRGIAGSAAEGFALAAGAAMWAGLAAMARAAGRPRRPGVVLSIVRGGRADMGEAGRELMVPAAEPRRTGPTLAEAERAVESAERDLVRAETSVVRARRQLALVEREPLDAVWRAVSEAGLDPLRGLDVHVSRLPAARDEVVRRLRGALAQQGFELREVAR